MLVYNCRPSDSVSIKTPQNSIMLTVDSIINKNSVKLVQLKINLDNNENLYLLKPEDSFSLGVGSEYLEIKIGHTTPTKTTLYVGPLENTLFKFVKGLTE